MKRILLIITTLLALSISFDASARKKALVYANHAEKIVAEIHNPASKYVVVASHRGDWRNYPENSIPAIESAIRMGVDIIEMDLKMTSDGVLVLCHDKTLDRTTNGKGKISDHTLAEIKALRLKRAHGVVTDSICMPTLEEALEVCKNRIAVNVDQGYEYYDQVLEITERLGMTHQILIKGKKSTAAVDKKMAQHEVNMMYMPIIDINKPQGRELFAEYMSKGIVPLAYEICWQNGSATETVDCMKKVISTGSKLWVNSLWGSLNDHLDDDRALAEGCDAVYGKLLDMGASMIQTDRPEMLIKYLESKGRR